MVSKFGEEQLQEGHCEKRGVHMAIQLVLTLEIESCALDRL